MKRLTTPELSFSVPQFIVDEMDNTENTKAKVTFKQGDKIVFKKIYIGGSDNTNNLKFISVSNKFKTILTKDDTKLLNPGVVKMELAIMTTVDDIPCYRIADTITANVEEVLLSEWDW